MALPLPTLSAPRQPRMGMHVGCPRSAPTAGGRPSLQAADGGARQGRTADQL